MVDEYEYFSNKQSHRVYVSKALEASSKGNSVLNTVAEQGRSYRIVSKTVDAAESHTIVLSEGLETIQTGPGVRQEIKAAFYEDTKEAFTLQLQKYEIPNGIPLSVSFTFQGEEIAVLLNLLRNIPVLPIDSSSGLTLEDDYVAELVLTSEQASDLIRNRPGLLDEIFQSSITKSDVVAIGYRKAQLEKFEKMLTDSEFIESERIKLGKNKRLEDVWQDYFENNNWIFGYGLEYVFNRTLDDKKLEQITSGANFNSGGKRVDGLMKSSGIINALSFVEIKNHDAPLLVQSKKPYRGESWAISDEVSGGIAQVHRSIQKSIEKINTKIEIKGKDGELTGEELYLYTPKSVLLIGTLGEFVGENGLNEDKYSSFQLFRRNIVSPEIITFDELFERAKYIVSSQDVKASSNKTMNL